MARTTRLITVSTLSADSKLHFPKEVASLLGAGPGDKIVWYTDEAGIVFVRRSS